MGFIFLGIAGIIATILLRKSAVTTAPPSNSGSSPRSGNYSPESWVPYLTPLLASSNIPLIFALNWIRLESGGNPCAFGRASAKGPDGNPLEQGIAQLYNPDDFAALKIPLGSFRIYCIPGTQQCSRMLTDNEMYAQARSLVGLIGRCVQGASAASTWPKADFWKVVKLVHALPGLAKGIGRVSGALGHAPSSWNEYKTYIMNGGSLDAGTERYRSDFPRLFDNAERCASGVH